MNEYLVDTYVLLWTFFSPKSLPAEFRKIISDKANKIHYSPISLWEISIKYGLKKLSLPNITPEKLFETINESFFICKGIDNNNLISSYNLPKIHKDPFDRLLIWECIKSGYTLLTVDSNIKEYKQYGLKIVC